MKKIVIVLSSIVVLLFSCTKEEPKIVIKKQIETVQQPVDSIQGIRWSLINTNETISQKDLHPEAAFGVKGIYLYNNELFCSNIQAKQVDVFDIQTNKFKYSIIDSEARMNSKDVFADEKHLFVAGISNPRSQVSVYDVKTKEYICKLGTGFWQNGITHAISVAASKKYILVRDQNRNIKVFNRNEISKAATLSVWATLDVENEWIRNDENYDMAINDEMLYVASNRNKAIYVFNLSQEISKNSKVAFDKKIQFSSNDQPIAIAFSEKNMFVSVKSTTAKILMFDKNPTDFSEPIADFSDFSNGRVQIITSLVAHDNKLYLNTNRNSIEIYKIEKTTYDLLEPKTKQIN